MKIYLYHGTSKKNAESILHDGFKDRVGAKTRNWEGNVISQRGYVYLTRAYAFYFAQAAAGEDGKAVVFKVEVDTKDLYPDEDFLRATGNVRKRVPVGQYQHLAEASFNYLGNVAVKPESIRIVGFKEFDAHKMWRWSDPSISPLNFKILGAYYQTLTEKWFAGEPWEHLDTSDFLGRELSTVSF